METWLTKHRTWLFAAAGILLLYLLTRVINLTGLPIFTDEAIYIRWSQIGANDASWRFISLSDGKQPLFTWIMMVFLRVIDDPLVAGRMVSVFAGIGTLIGIGFLSWELFRSRRITLLSGALYVLSPFALMYDRLALYDSLSAAIAIWNLFLAIRLVRFRKLDIALVLGMTLGLGMINKTSGFLSLYMIPFTLLLFPWHQKDRMKQLFRWIYLAGVAAVLSQLVYGILRLSPLFGMIAQKDHVFVHPYGDFPILLRYFRGNLMGLFDWVIHYLSLPMFVTVLASLLFRQTYFRQKALILLWWFLPFVALGYFAKVLYPRFVLFMVMPLLPLAAFTIDAILTRWKISIRTLALVGFIVFPSIYTSYYLVTNPIYAPIPASDRGQMIDDWPAGSGMKEINQLIREELQKGSVAVFTEGTFGLLPYAVEIYFWENPNVYIKGIWPLPEEFPNEIKESSLKQTTYFIFNQTQIVPPKWPLTLISEYQKGTNKDVKLRLFKVTPPIASL